MLLKKICALAVGSVIVNGAIIGGSLVLKEHKQEEVKEIQKREPQWEEWAKGLNNVTSKYDEKEMKKDDHEANML